MFRINTLRRTIVALIFLPLLAQAQDFSGILRNTVGRVFGDTVNGALRSITTASAAQVGRFGGSEAAIYLGEEHQGYYRVAVDQGEGWVNKLLVRGLEQ